MPSRRYEYCAQPSINVYSGKSAYLSAVENGYEGTETEWVGSLNGSNGKSAHELAVEEGTFTGTLTEYLASLIGDDGDDGDDGKSAYQLAVDGGTFTGTLTEYIASLIGDDGDNGDDGKSAYQLAVDEGTFTGTLTAYLASLVGGNGDDGDDGLSAYQLAVQEGTFAGTLAGYLDSLVGPIGPQGPADGQSAYQLAVQEGYVGTLTQWLASLEGYIGSDGKSSYQLAVDVGLFTGTLAAYLESLNGQSAYQLAVTNGLFSGSLTQYLISLQGAQGPQGPSNGVVGPAGPPGVVTGLIDIIARITTLEGFSPLDNTGQGAVSDITYKNNTEILLQDNLLLNPPLASSGASVDWTPEVLKDATMTLWLDASQLTAVPAIWQDKSDYNNHATLIGSNTNGDVSLNTRNGKSVIRFSGAAGSYYQWNTRLEDIRTAVVVSKRVGGIGPILGDTAGTSHFHSNSSYYFLSHACPFYHNGLVYLNGKTFNGNTSSPALWTAQFGGGVPTEVAKPSFGYDVIIVDSNVDLTAGNFGNDRNIATRIWDGDVCEIILFDRQLTLPESRQLEGYLAHKWDIATNLPISGFVNDQGISTDPHPYQAAAPQVDGLYLANWEKISGSWDNTKLAIGVLKGSPAVVVRQNISVQTGEIYDVYVDRADNQESLVVKILTSHNVKWLSHLNDITNQADVPYNTTARFQVLATAPTYLDLDTIAVELEVTAISMKKVIMPGGLIQELTNNTIQKISGGDAWNAGTSSVEFIGGQAEGYIQWQIAESGKQLKVGLTYDDLDFGEVTPFQIFFTGTTAYAQTYPNAYAYYCSYLSGDWFRLRHDSANNQILFQKRNYTDLTYETKYTFGLTTNGSNLHLDTSFFHEYSRINDVSMVN